MLVVLNRSPILNRSPMAPTTPTKKYESYTPETRQRVVDCAREGGDWQTLAEMLKVNPAASRQWVRRYVDGPDSATRARGGSKKKLNAAHIEFMCAALDDNNKLTLQNLADKLRDEFAVSVSVSTVARELDGACYTLKKTHVEPQYMNTDENKRKRAEFLADLLEYKSHGYTVFYVDETNFNMWITRTQGRSKKGERCVDIKVASGGRNMHVIACVSNGGLTYYENRFGSNRTPDMNEFFVRLLRCVRDTHNHPLDRAVFVFDNAPCHTSVETVFDMPEFCMAKMLRLGPYSPMLNPIESVFSSFKSKVKSYLAREGKNVRQTPTGTTLVAHRSAYLERASNMFIGEAATAELCKAFDAHTLRFYRDVFMLNDLPVGK